MSERRFLIVMVICSLLLSMSMVAAKASADDPPLPLDEVVSAE